MSYRWDRRWPVEDTVARLVDEVGLSPAERAGFTPDLIGRLALPPGGVVEGADLDKLTTLLQALHQRVLPFVTGALRRWQWILPGADDDWLESECSNQSWSLTVKLWHGNCLCHQIRSRMGNRTRRHAYVISRMVECGRRHRLKGWREGVPLDEFLARAIVHMRHWPANRPPKVIERLVAHYALQGRERGRGMLLPEVHGPRGEHLEVYSVAECEQCNTEVQLNNTCHCPGLPTVRTPQTRFNASGGRTPARMYRCGCEGPTRGLLFFPTGDHRVCPAGTCGLRGPSTTVHVPNAGHKPPDALFDDDHPDKSPPDTDGNALSLLLELPAALNETLEHYDAFRGMFQSGKRIAAAQEALHSILINRLDSTLVAEELRQLSNESNGQSADRVPETLQQRAKGLAGRLKQLESELVVLQKKLHAILQKFGVKKRALFMKKFLDFVRKYGASDEFHEE